MVLRKTCVASLRAYQRAGRKGSPREQLNEEFRTARKRLRLAIRMAQEASWQKLIDSIEADPWGLAYRIVTKKIGYAPADVEAISRKVLITDGLFPMMPPPRTE